MHPFIIQTQAQIRNKEIVIGESDFEWAEWW